MPAIDAPGFMRYPGMIYLLRCAKTGIYKVGATTKPSERLAFWTAFWSELYLVSVIVTNGIGPLEQYLIRRWKPHRLSSKRVEWFRLPQDEVRMFRSVGLYNWSDLPPITQSFREQMAEFVLENESPLNF